MLQLLLDAIVPGQVEPDRPIGLIVFLLVVLLLAAVAVIIKKRKK